MATENQKIKEEVFLHIVSASTEIDDAITKLRKVYGNGDWDFWNVEGKMPELNRLRLIMGDLQIIASAMGVEQ